MVANISASLQPTASQAVSRLKYLVCGARWIGDCLIYTPTCPACGGTMALIETLSLHDPWWHLRPRVEVA
jgi:hypothetical protein